MSDLPVGEGRRIRLAVVGCGDVAARHYLPALATLADEVEVTAVVDPAPGLADAAAALVRAWSPGARAYGAIEAFLADGGADAAYDLTPAPLHGPVNRVLLDAGLHLYSEKPLAASLPEADALIALAAERGVRFLCAPGSAVSPRVRWLRRLVDSGRYGRGTLAVAHHADPGPAAWREYTGDPAVFYRRGVGPVFDHGVYRLHELTAVLGPVRRVQAMGAIGSRTRLVRGGPRTGSTIEVDTPDHVLLNLELAGGALAQVLASFGTPDTRAPWLELHLERATVSFGGKSWEPDAPVSLYVDDDGPTATEGWIEGLDVPSDPAGVVATGAIHFVRHLQGRAPAVLTPEHARHVLEVILLAYASIDDGRAHDCTTTFGEVPDPL